jgi:hypothetical protein
MYIPRASITKPTRESLYFSGMCSNVLASPLVPSWTRVTRLKIEATTTTIERSIAAESGRNRGQKNRSDAKIARKGRLLVQ